MDFPDLKGDDIIITHIFLSERTINPQLLSLTRIKLHTLLDVKTDIPAFNIITDAGIHDSKVMNQIPYEPGAYYVFDRAYMDTKQLYEIHKKGSYFVVREKRKMIYAIAEDFAYENPETGVLTDQLVVFKALTQRSSMQK